MRVKIIQTFTEGGSNNESGKEKSLAIKKPLAKNMTKGLT